MISMKIVTMNEASSKPAGDGQDEPNDDPFLVKPTAGRRLGDLLAGAGLGFSLFNFGLIKKIFLVVTIMGSLLVSIMILFVKPGILVN